MALPLHAAVVHVPLGLAVVMPLVAAALTVAVWRGHLPRTAFALVAALQLVLASAGLLAMQLGEAEGRRAELAVPHAAIEAHEDAAEAFVWVALGVAVVAAAALFVPARAALALGALVTAGAVAVLALGVVAGERGGVLVFEHGAAVRSPPGIATPPAEGGEH
ncbi:MAG TPA: hypothetical protein VFG59_05780 [Anaeromyxobacter sp.]|nr:hypothetical protein [Anaeromyxobacter sp.]